MGEKLSTVKTYRSVETVQNPRKLVSIDNHGATLPHIPPKGHVRSHDDVTTLMYVLVI